MLTACLRQGVPAALQQGARLLASQNTFQAWTGCLSSHSMTLHCQAPASSLAPLLPLPTQRVQCYATDSSYADEVDKINEMFVEARDEIDYAKEDAETTYFDESATAARDSVSKVLDAWKQLMDRLPEQEQGKLQRSMGLKMEQLKAELQGLDELHA